MRLDGQSWLRVWAYPMLLAGVALGFDAANRAVPFGLLTTGPLDEIAHLATAALGLSWSVSSMRHAAFMPRRWWLRWLSILITFPSTSGCCRTGASGRSHIPWPRW